MNRIKRIKTAIILFYVFLIMLGILSVVDAHGIVQTADDKVTIDVNGGNPKESNITLGYNNVFCVQQGSKVNSGDVYTVTQYWVIDGNEAIRWKGNKRERVEGKTVNDENAKLAWIFAQKDERENGQAGSNMHTSDYSQKQKEIYTIFPLWSEANGSVAAGVKDKQYASTAWQDKAQEYADSVKKEAKIEDKTVKENLNKEIYIKDGEQYIKIGPFNFNYIGEYTETKVYDQDRKEIAVKFAKYVGNNLEIYQNLNDASEPSKDFYMLVPVNLGISRISEFTATVKYGRDNYVAQLWILQKDNQQNIISEETSEEEKSSTDHVSVKDIDLTGNLKIVKCDEDRNDIKLSDVGFKIKNNQNGMYIKNENGQIKFVNESEATEWYTDKNGEIKIDNMLMGEYTIYETKNPHEEYLLVADKQSSVKIVASSENVCKITNKRKYIDISGYVWEDMPWSVGKSQTSNELYQDSSDDQNDKKLENIVVRLKEGDTIVSEATTDSNGNYTFKKIDIDKLADYYIEFEYNGMSYQSVDTINLNKANASKSEEGNARTEFNNKFATIMKDQAISEDGNQVDLKYNVENNKSTIKLGDNLKYGYNGAKNPVNGVYDHYLIKSNTSNTYGGNLDKIKSPEQIRQDGTTELTDINLGLKEREQPDIGLTKDLYKAKVQVGNYNHIYNYADRYKNVEPNENVTDPTIKFGTKYGNRSYTRSLYASDIVAAKNGETTLGVNVIYEITLKNESTDLVALIKSLNEYYDSKYELLKIGNAVDNETGEVIINDGLNGKGDVNGDGEVNFLDGILVLRYTQGITQLTSEQLTKADVNLDGRVDEKDANMILEYDAEIISGFNKANLNIQKDIGDVNGDGEVNFLDAAMILRYIRGIDTFTDEQKEKADFNLDGKIDENDARMILEYDAGISDGYKKSILNINLTIAPQSEQKVYIELKVKPENIYEIIDKGVDVKLDNIVEITSYGSRDEDGNIYAGIDKDSQPGNTDVTDKTTWEDDTDRAPGLLLKLQEERKTNGTVFEDSTDNTIKPGEARQGNGQYDAGEKGISGITVRLVDESGKTVNKYVKSDKGWETEEAKTTTDQNGNYEISGFLPGKYHLEYTWGGQTNKDENGNEYIYRVQNYKSTIWTEESRKEKNTGLEWYKTNAQSNSPRYSDALDNYETRTTIDDNGRDVTNKVQHELKDTSNLPKMTSTTPDFMVNLEYNTGETESGTNDEYELVDGNIKVDENGYVVKKDGYKNELKNIDFGIVRRPKQQISLDKYVKEAKITLANGNVLIDAKMKDDGTLENEVKYVSYIPKVDGTEGSKGQLKIEIDSELIHGATLEVTYGFKVKNISEIDYATSDYYYYGTVKEADKDKIITLTPKQIIDYVDNDLVIADNEKWSTVENKTKLQDDGLLEKGNDMTKHLNSVNKILLYETPEDVKLKPIGADSETTFDVELKATRLLANSTDETYMENNAEIIEVVKTGGSILVTTPGNYIPADSTTYESDSSSSESLVVLPPTGLTTNVIAWTMIALASLVIFIPGIILIKKYVLKK